MAASYTIDRSTRIALLECSGGATLDDLEHALDALLGEAEFDQSFGLLLVLGGESVCLEPTHALAVVELLTKRSDRVRSGIAVYVPPSVGIVPGRLITMLGRHHGLTVEAFEDRRAAARWLGERVGRGSALAG